MAISAAHRQLVRSMCETRMLTAGAAVLEIGQALWSGPINRQELLADAQRFVPDPDRRAALEQRVNQLVDELSDTVRRELVRIFYEILFAPSDVQTIEFDDADEMVALNHPMSLGRRFGLVVNHGTAEHVFNVAQVFRTMHDHAAPGGMMIHESPFTGCLNHGFYNLHPTLFVDVAVANEYEILGMFIEDLANHAVVRVTGRDHLYEMIQQRMIPNHSALFTVLRNGAAERPFTAPMQAYYSGTLTGAGVQAWHQLR